MSGRRARFDFEIRVEVQRYLGLWIWRTLMAYDRNSGMHFLDPVTSKPSRPAL